MRLASSTARMSVSWSGLFMAACNSTESGNQSGGKWIRSGDALSQDPRRLPQKDDRILEFRDQSSRANGVALLICGVTGFSR
jgi:hypothetical protein